MATKEHPANKELYTATWLPCIYLTRFRPGRDSPSRVTNFDIKVYLRVTVLYGKPWTVVVLLTAPSSQLLTTSEELRSYQHWTINKLRGWSWYGAKEIVKINKTNKHAESIKSALNLPSKSALYWLQHWYDPQSPANLSQKTKFSGFLHFKLFRDHRPQVICHKRSCICWPENRIILFLKSASF